MNFLIGLVIVVGGWWLIRAFANAQPAKVRGLIRKVGGGAIIAFSGLLALRGQVNLAMPLFMLGLGLMGQQALDIARDDYQKLLPTFVLTQMPLVMQILFFGALLSAIKSTSSATFRRMPSR